MCVRSSPRGPAHPARLDRVSVGDPAADRAHPAAVGLRHRNTVVTAPTPALAADLVAGLRRLKLAAMRSVAPELLVTAKTQRWAPEEFLRTGGGDHQPRRVQRPGPDEGRELPGHQTARRVRR